MNFRCVQRAAHGLSTSNLRAIHSSHPKLLQMTSQQESKPFGAGESLEGFGLAQASGSGSSSRVIRNGGASNLKAMESEDAAQHDGRSPNSRGPTQRGGHIQRGGHTQRGGYTQRVGYTQRSEHTQRDEYTQRTARGTHARPSRGRPAHLGNREASGPRKQQQTRTSNHDRTQKAWSVEEPKIRVDATATRVLLARDRIKLHVQSSVKRMFGQQYRVQYFGSTWYGVSHSHSDLDLVVIDPAHPQGFKKKNLREPIYSPRKLAKEMTRCGFTKVEFRAHSTVPIVKFKDKKTGLECDLNVNGRLGIVNSNMIKEYCDNSRVLRPLLFSIKEWAKPLQLNSPSGVGVPASFSSYAFALMTITFLQSEGLLPNLQADLPALSPEEEKKTLIWSQKPHQGWDTRFRRLRDYTPPVEPDVETLLLKWFQFWPQFPFDEKCASIRHGAFVDRGSAVLSGFSEKNPLSPVCIIDPFIRSKNCTAQVSRKVLERFKDECEKAAARMLGLPQPSSES